MIYLGLLIIVLLCTIGTCELIQIIAKLVFEKSDSGNRILVLPLKGDVDNLEFTIKQMKYQNEWKLKTSYQIYLIDMGMSEETQRIVSILQQDIDGITLCTEEEFPSVLRKNLRLQNG